MNKKFNFASFAIVLALVIGLVPCVAFALDNGVYTCKVTTYYAHPQTGVIEDSGGESSKKMGQSMTEGAVSPDGLFEKTSNGDFVTLRFVLMDAVSDVNFFVDDKAVPHEVVGEQTNSKGNTSADLRLAVPSESAVIKCKMYVEPMDRNVIFFMTVSDLKPGHGDFKVSESQATASSSSDGLSSAKSDALSKIEALKNLDTAQRDLFVSSVKGAKDEAQVKEALDNAVAADTKAEEENALGEAKSAAYKQIDEMNLSPEKAKELKQQIKDAKTVAEVEKIMKGEDSSYTMPIIIGAAAVAAVVIFFAVKGKKKPQKAKSKPREFKKNKPEDNQTKAE